MATWIRFESSGTADFGTLDGDAISVHEGKMFDSPTATGKTIALEDEKVLLRVSRRKCWHSEITTICWPRS
jgi:hypothetical protein